jgi:hypothetical protein
MVKPPWVVGLENVDGDFPYGKTGTEDFLGYGIWTRLSPCETFGTNLFGSPAMEMVLAIAIPM